MPEGDTILRAARALHRALAGRAVLRFRSPLPAFANAALEGRRVERVDAHGKSLLVHLDDGRVIHTHQRLTGSWHIYRPGERWQKPERSARLVLETDAFVAVCFNAPVVELLRPDEAARHPTLSRLGPDVLAPAFDEAEALRRLRARPDAPIGEALLDQGALAGIGNVYKSEALFLCRADPFAPVGALPDGALERLVAEARALMAQNLAGDFRTTRRALTGPRVWVYRRSGEPCLACGTPIRMRRQGTAARSTYYCPVCQGVP